MNFKIHSVAHRVATGQVGGKTRTAGRIEFVRDQGPVLRNMRVPGFKWDADTLKTLARILWAAQRSHSYGMAALRLFSRMPSSNFSPDGLLGGRGYIQAVKDMRANLASSVETLSGITDTIYDEINADHWKMIADGPLVNDIVQSVQEERANPEKVVSESFEDTMEDGASIDPSVEAKRANPEVRVSSDTKSRFTEDAVLKRTEQIITRTASSSSRLQRMLVDAQLASSLPISTLPGPRVDHIGPGEGGELGDFNPPSDASSDDPMGEGIINNNDPLYAGEVADGVSPYDNPTDGDSSIFKMSFSQLPGVNNEVMPNVYERFLQGYDVLKAKKTSDKNKTEKFDVHGS